jgi:DNA-binding NtrC family response regulator
VVTATNRDLKTEAARGRFRPDLFYRLEVMTLTIPPLRQRVMDVPELTALFMRYLSVRLGVPPLPVTPEVTRILMAHSWPGNVRELRNFVERSLLFGEFPLNDLDVNDLDGGAAGDAVLDAAAVMPDILPLAEVEKRHILAVLAQCGGNKTRAAELLGVSRKTLDRKCAEWGV